MDARRTTGKIAPPNIPGMRRVGEVRVSARHVALASVACVVAGAATALGATVLHRAADWSPETLPLGGGSMLLDLALVMLAVGLVHEASHAAAARTIASLPWRRIAIVPSLRGLGVHCRITGRVSVRHHRWIGAAPILVTVLPLVAWSVLTGAVVPTMAAMVALLYLPQDAARLWQLRRFLPEDVVAGAGHGDRAVVFRRERPQES